MDALFNNAGPSYLPSACKIVFIKCWISPLWPTSTGARVQAGQQQHPGGPDPGPGHRGHHCSSWPRQGSHPASCPLLCCGHYPASCPPPRQCPVLTRAQPHCDLSSEWLLRAGSCNANMLICLECFLVCMKIEGGSNPRKVLFLFILFCVTFIALAFSPKLTIRYLFCQHSGFYCYKCRDTQVWIVWKMKQYFPKLLKTFC